MKRVKEYAYGFDINEELTIYSRIGEEKSPYQNYCEWHGYVCKKYGGGKYAESTLKNLEWLYYSDFNSLYCYNIHACIFCN